MNNQEAIEHIKNIRVYSYQDGYTDEAREALDMAISALQAQDLQSTCNQLATDCISRQAAIDAINQICPIDTEYDCTLLDRVDVRCVLTDLPSAQPEIVRCKYCKFWREHKYAKYAKGTKRYIPFCGLNAIYTKSDDFCSKGERRTDEWMGNS